MIDPADFEGVLLRGGFTLVRVQISDDLLHDAMDREAIARTQITGRKIEVAIRPGLSDREWSVTLYHEILEAMTVASDRPPESVWEFNEADFEHAGYEAVERLGLVSPQTLNLMLQFYGFRED